MTVMARHTKPQRRRAASLVPAQGVDRVAASHGVTAATVQRWCREFPNHTGDTGAYRGRGARLAPAAAMTAAQRHRLSGLSLGLSRQDFKDSFWTSGSDPQFAPREFTAALAAIARKPRRTATTAEALDALTEAVAEVTAAARRHIGTRHDEAVASHVERLDAVVRVCGTKAAGSGPARGLEVLNDTLARWGRGGIHPDRLSQGDIGRRFDELRLKAETAAETLTPQVTAHRGYDNGFDRRRRPQCSATPFGVELAANFERWDGNGIFEQDPDYPAELRLSPTGRATLTNMAKEAATEAGLGSDEHAVDVTYHEKGLVTVTFFITDPAAYPPTAAGD